VLFEMLRASKVKYFPDFGSTIRGFDDETSRKNTAVSHTQGRDPAR
jgi:hypothetical protein